MSIQLAITEDERVKELNNNLVFDDSYVPMQWELDAQKIFDEVGVVELTRRLDELSDKAQKRLDNLPPIHFDASGDCAYGMFTAEERQEYHKLQRALKMDMSNTPSTARERLVKRAKERRLANAQQTRSNRNGDSVQDT